MPSGLRRYQQTGDLHFLTFSCYRRQPNLRSPAARTRFETSLEATRARSRFQILGYVIMPEHVHLLVTDRRENPSQQRCRHAGMQAIRLTPPSAACRKRKAASLEGKKFERYPIGLLPIDLAELRTADVNPLVLHSG